ncbi:MAG: cytochrome c-type biogenesis protein CcmH [Gemmatimonadetes bacterium]|nr:MAG: cytochrome c-type biogenesis protein CcmH [Gemmatimonadota bacterium]
MKCVRWLLITLLVFATTSYAELTPEQKKVAAEAQQELLAPCCWRSPIADHESDIAMTMRREVNQMAEEGKSKDEIVDFYIAEYGSQILSIPTREGFNMVAWIMPVIMLVLGVIMVILILLYWRRQTTAATSAMPVVESISSEMDERIEQELRAQS